jgi:hypothetical protein
MIYWCGDHRSASPRVMPLGYNTDLSGEWVKWRVHTITIAFTAPLSALLCICYITGERGVELTNLGGVFHSI